MVAMTRDSVGRWIRSNIIMIVFFLALLSATAAVLYFPGSGGVEPDSNGSNGSAVFNRADVMFMSMMIVHHDQAIEMAELAPNRTENRDVLRLAQNISEAQRGENRQMAEWLRQLGYERPEDGHRMAGMASDAEMAQLRNSSGESFDRLFARLMIAHHRGGIQMAQSFSERGRNPELIEMERQMIVTQQREIGLMQEWGLAS